MDPKCILHCEEVLDYTFADKRLLEVAMCHTSAATTRELSNERMEFLGDAVLGLSVVSLLY
jgi:ribonuclease-3